MDANTMAKAANGICDGLLGCVLRAWDHRSKKPILAFPAMNTYMWEHPVTMEHVLKLRSFGYRIIDPIEKTLVCGDVGVGAMAEIPTIMATIRETLHLEDEIGRTTI
jgi:phosphopantothenoylcysteine decarboxylase